MDSVVSLSALIFGFFFAVDLLEDVDWHDVTSLTGLDAATLAMSLSGEDCAGAGLMHGFGMSIGCCRWSCGRVMAWLS